MTRKRRGFGEGSIYQRQDGRWVARVSLGYGADGKRTRKTVYGKTKREAQEKLSKLQSQKLDGSLLNVENITFGECLDRWLNDSARLTVAPSTYHRYSVAVRVHVKPALGSIQLAKLSAAHIQNAYSQMDEAGKPAATREYCHSMIRRALNVAVKWRLIPFNPCAGVDAPRVERKEIEPLSAEHALKLLETSKSHRLHAVFVVSIGTGMRQGEVFGLQWENVDLENGVIAVRHNLEEIQGRLRLKTPKSKSGKRSIELPKTVVSALWDHRARMMTEGFAGGSYVFVDVNGNPLRKSNFDRQVWKPIRKAAEIPEVRWHDQRHTHATMLLEQGVHPKVVQERLGHSSIRLTLDTYSHVMPSLQKDAAEKLDRLLG